ncbi:hypothetical protein BC828DRAFT_378645 [Blastocladiella britannica]|nr:hypothetical protein BC828DRAFT_378645 [Blastocladiella britannica]
MTVKPDLELSLHTSADTPASTVHLLPCTIHATRPAPVASYFVPQAGAELGTLEATLRGRKLVGIRPDLYSYGAVIVEARRDNNDDEEANELATGRGPIRIATVAKIDDLVVWDHDQVPSVHTDDNFNLLRALEYAWLASAIHAPLEPPPAGAATSTAPSATAVPAAENGE